MSRVVDHVVLAVRDLDAAAAAYEAMGFTLTSQAQHPFGTGNRLALLDGDFIELLAVTQPGDISEAGDGAFSFGAYNRDFLGGREGMSMLALQSDDWQADRDEFEKKKLKTYWPFEFSRQAAQPDGSEVTVGFKLTFVTDDAMPHMPFFTCHHQHTSEFFYKPQFQEHANGALRIMRVIVLSRDPRETDKFLIKLDMDLDQMAVFSPNQFRDLFPAVTPPNTDNGSVFAGYWVVVENLNRTCDVLAKGGVPVNDSPKCVEVGPEFAFGATVVFSEELR
jgi:catechol 2,3-dioxygenase-like lactoylglutathione lyase family enzyme